MHSNVKFAAAVHRSQDFPPVRLPELVLAGRSNVGKSSFINSFYHVKGLAKVSQTPGKTRSLNYYLVDDTYYAVDLPGYGYAKASKEDQKKWISLIEMYFRESGMIRLAMLLVDGRVTNSPLDEEMRNFVEQAGIPYVLLISKADKLKQADIAAVRKRFRPLTQNSSAVAEPLFYSSITGAGKKEIQKLLFSQFYPQ